MTKWAYVLHSSLGELRLSPPRKSCLGDSRWFTTRMMASCSFEASYLFRRAGIGPLMENHRGEPNTSFASSLYACMHSHIPMRSLPSMTLIRLI